MAHFQIEIPNWAPDSRPTKEEIEFHYNGAEVKVLVEGPIVHYTSSAPDGTVIINAFSLDGSYTWAEIMMQLLTRLHSGWHHLAYQQRVYLQNEGIRCDN